ncbi:MAG: hypothetical protein ED557_14135 [Balneola sp.]|nr:MAG: hypothetical protein ED557_14135 [Balneola sp.]
MISKILKVLKPKSSLRKYNSLTVDSFFNLSESEQKAVCQRLTPYKPNEWDIFKAVEKKFIDDYGDQEAVSEVFCGLAPGVGPYNSINVTILKAKKRVNLPKHYLGFPVLKHFLREK